MQRITFSIPKAQVNKLRATQAATGLAASDIVRRALESYLQAEAVEREDGSETDGPPDAP